LITDHVESPPKNVLHLGMPWSMLPPAAREQLKDLCTEIHFYDGGCIVKNRGEWGIWDLGRSDEVPGFLGLLER